MMWLFLFSGLIAHTGKSVSASCQLQMNPPSVVVRYGDSFSVNCSSLSNQTFGMGWESTDSGTGLRKGVSSITLDIDAVKKWMIEPQCYSTLSDDTQCLTNLPVTVYKTPDSVSLSQLSEMGPMVEGRMYRMQCDIAEVAPAKNLSVYWYKGNEISFTDAFSEPSASPVNKSSFYNVIPKSGDNGTQIWCEAKLNFLPQGSRKQSKPYEVIVLYPPIFDKPANETVVVSAGEKILLNCAAKGNPLPKYSWHLPKPIQQMHKNRNDNQLILTQSLQFPGNYTCTVSNTHGTKVKYFTVTEAPSSHPGTTAGILMAVIFVSFFILGCVVYHKQKNSSVTSPESLNRGAERLNVT
ncbi:leucine-rich repeats and immunoglobulin-like domains protein 1 isoform X2 [Toxotes jaculatrix]|uniref:leucine-rich repeats and immunoglobulin-like domains protein 1 isoform X2 n=1 Tax=Toxotes jaculatrix TaxID=941984 RepID=UPI001B3AC596|nr:leucine-rich repeats and immunoglobulin-like domains protein 1 isoform X2 [Toxotes jaculatrix]